MSLCPVCGRVYCDHTAEERGQIHDEMMASPTPKEMRAWRTGTDEEKIAVAVANRFKQRRKRKNK